MDRLKLEGLQIINGLNEKCPCIENEDTIMYLLEAISKLNDRKTDREKRGVEGFSKN
jgi:hypothetical protein